MNEAAIPEKMEDFRRHGLRVPWVLIDDGWSEADWLQEGLIIRIGDLQAGDVVQVFW